MKLVTFSESGHTRVGAIVVRDVVDAAGALGRTVEHADGSGYRESCAGRDGGTG